jgi:hypothetical protein
LTKFRISKISILPDLASQNQHFSENINKLGTPGYRLNFQNDLFQQSVLNNKDVDWRIPSLDEEMRKMKESGAFPGPSSTKKQKEDGEISSDEGPLKNDVLRVMDKSPLRTTHAQFQKSPSRKLDGPSSNSRYRHRYRTRKRFHNEIDHDFVVSPRHSAFSPLPPPPLPPSLNETESTHSSISAGLIESRTTESVSWRKPQFIFFQKDTLYEPASSTKMENLCDNFEEINMEISNSGMFYTGLSDVEICIKIEFKVNL